MRARTSRLPSSAAGELVGLAHVAAEIGNTSLISDAAVAASLAFAAFQSAHLHVELNAARASPTRPLVRRLPNGWRSLAAPRISS